MPAPTAARSTSRRCRRSPRAFRPMTPQAVSAASAPAHRRSIASTRNGRSTPLSNTTAWSAMPATLRWSQCAARATNGWRARASSTRSTGSASAFSAPFAPRHKRQSLEQMYVLLVLDERAVQRRDQLLAVTLAQGLGTDVLDHQELEPVEQLRG